MNWIVHIGTVSSASLGGEIEIGFTMYNVAGIIEPLEILDMQKKEDLRLECTRPEYRHLML